MSGWAIAGIVVGVILIWFLISAVAGVGIGKFIRGPKKLALSTG